MKINDPVMPIKMKLKTPVIDERVIPNPPGEPTELLETIGIKGEIYDIGVQPDWNENDDTSKSFIKNKPTKLSNFTNDRGFIDNTVNNLTNYYKKSETYTQQEVNTLIAAITTISIVVVQELPTTDIQTNVIYLTPKNPGEPDNIYDEYINLDGTTTGWEKIGDTQTDLSNYYTKTETDTLLNGKVDKDGDKVLSDNNYSDTDKTKLDGIEANANHTEVDTEISSTSENPLQNKAIYDLLNDLLPESEETGNPISISNASGFNTKALTVDILPIQDTSGGVPSPTNICPISGRTSVDVTVNGETETLNFGQTVYGGTCDVVNGRTSDEWKKITVKLSEAGRTDPEGSTYTRYRFLIDIAKSSIRTSAISDKMTYQTSGGEFNHFNINSNGNYMYIFMPNDMPTTEEFEVCYPLDTPTTISTTATTIPLEKGNNTLSTSGDNMDLKYSTTISNPTTLSLGNPLSMVRPTVEEPEVEEPTEEVGEMER